ncbi:MAG: DNRLRE domain-containing protein [Planctomycetes bacterium]|nr:DNRLRE domain-containing protein [Planctomycetota bacterium]
MASRSVIQYALGMFLTIASVAAGEANGGTIKAPDKPPLEGTWEATFEDNFDGPILDSTKWKIAQHWDAINGGAQPHPENMKVENGALVFTWDKKKAPFTFGNRQTAYGTGEVTTYKRFHQAFGYIETRMKYDVQRGCWPAFWTMPVLKGTDKLNEMKWAYLKFDLAAAEKPTKAVLKLKVKAAPANASYWFDVYRSLDDSWDQAKLTWKNKPVFDAIFLAQVKTKAEAGAWVEADVTKFVQEQSAGDKKATFVLADVQQQSKAFSFYSSEADEADRPRLELDGKAVLAAEDAYVYAAKPDENFGAEKELALFDGYSYVVSTFEKGMEIDILETLGIWGPGKLSHALHWDGYEKQHKSTGKQVSEIGDLNTWTTIGLYWTEGKLEFYVNGKNTWTYADARVCSAPSFLLLSGQTGGWDKNGDKFDVNFDPNLPKHMYFDYVKVWAGKKKEQ